MYACNVISILISAVTMSSLPRKLCNSTNWQLLPRSSVSRQDQPDNTSNNNTLRTSVWSISTSRTLPKIELYLENHSREACFLFPANTRLSWPLSWGPFDTSAFLLGRSTLACQGKEGDRTRGAGLGSSTPATVLLRHHRYIQGQ